MENLSRTIFKVLASLWLGVALAGCDRSESGSEEPSTELIEDYQGPLVSELSEDEFDEFVRIGGRLVVVDFYADWCGPCRQLSPILESLTQEFDGSVVLGKVNVDKANDLKRKMGVSGIPDVRIYLNGKEVERFKGAPPASHVKELFAMHAPLSVQVSQGVTNEGQASEPAVQPMTKDWLPPGMERK